MRNFKIHVGTRLSLVNRKGDHKYGTVTGFKLDSARPSKVLLTYSLDGHSDRVDQYLSPTRIGRITDGLFVTVLDPSGSKVFLSFTDEDILAGESPKHFNRQPDSDGPNHDGLLP